MSRNLATVLHHTAARTFEEMTFALPLEGADPSPDSRSSTLDPSSVLAVVDFHGPFGGRLEVGVSSALLSTIAANMLGQEEPPPLPEQRDALRELANVICGNLLPAIAGRGPVFHLDAPWIVDADATPAGQPLAAETVVAFDEGRATLRLFVAPDALA